MTLLDDLMGMDPGNRWDPPLWLTGTVAHAYKSCPDMRPNAKVCTIPVDPYVRRRHGPTACPYCVERWKAET